MRKFIVLIAFILVAHCGVSYAGDVTIKRISPKIERARIERPRVERERPRMESVERKSLIKEGKETSWINVELKDEEAVPVSSKQYGVTSPDGETIERGSLGSSGQGHALVPEPGTCEIDFPDLDSEAWERTEAEEEDESTE